MTQFLKGQRQRMIADWLRSERIASQDELVARLAQAGLGATQATVSRDLDELGAIRLKRGGEACYALPDAVDPDIASARLDRLLAEWVESIVAAGSLVVLRTPPGSANLVAGAIDAARIAEIAGTIAGDDTVFVALAEGVDSNSAADRLRARRAG